jgi:heme-degrading monooxygenase HmoA
MIWLRHQMMNAVKSQPGFIAVYSAKNDDGLGMTNSYWSSLDAIAAWKENSAHQVIQQKGQSTWYAWYQLQVCEIIRSY